MDVFGLGKVSDNGLEIMKMVYPDVAQPGLQKVGQALGTVLDLGNTILLPLKLANANATVFFQHHMDKYRKKIEAIPENNIGIVQPTIGLKIIDELLTVTNEEIAEMFITLLTNASTIDRSKYAHPSFIDLIKNLSEDEAKIINEIYSKEDKVIYAELYAFEEGGHLPIPLDIEINSVSNQLELGFPEMSDFYLNNLEKLGIIQRTDGVMEGDSPRYEPLLEVLKPTKDQYNIDLSVPQINGRKLTVENNRGRYIITSYGKNFLKSISSIKN